MDAEAPIEDITQETTFRGCRPMLNIVLTPNSYPPLTTNGRVIELDGFTISKLYNSDDPDIVCLRELGNTFLSVMSLKPSLAREADGTSNSTPQIPCDALDCSTEDDHYVQYFQNVVARNLIPHDVSDEVDGIEGPVNDIISLSKTWIALRHAIRAVSTLYLAVDGRPDLLAESFNHYSKAIRACIGESNDSSPTSPLAVSLYLHFILLLFDMCCASQEFLPEKQVWTAHIDQLARLAYQIDTIKDSQASLLWYALQLDLNSCLAGDSRAGSLVKAYQSSEWQSPFSYKLPCSATKSVDGTYDGTAYDHCRSIENLIRAKLAELSQLASEIRAEVERDPTSITEVQQQIFEFRNQLRQCWQHKIWRFFTVGLERVKPSLIPKLKTIYGRSCIQYSTAMLYLSTSMYVGQYCHTFASQHADITRHSKRILVLASEMVETGDAWSSLLGLPVFLAGIVSRESRDRDACRTLCHAVKAMCPIFDISKIEKVLDKGHRKHTCQSAYGICLGGMDWVSLCRSCGMAN